ncbi:MAG: efflux RND transporter periplasmic adaptor subunit [Bacteroidaceae bacterium]|nr:efflux RND transporter periplasmic adaptor subunit [Bacteroidaceae bacterium]
MRRNLKSKLLTIVSGMLLLSACSGQQKQQETPITVFKTTKVAKSDITLEASYNATIRGRQDVEVYPQVSGTLQKILVTEGQNVRKGQTMFIIDQVPYQAALNTAEAALKAAQAQEATAQLNYDSRKQLFDQQVVSDYDLQTAHNSLLSAKASVAQAQAQVINARNSLSYTVVKSPADGVVGTLPYRQGALVGPSIPQSLTTVSDNNQMWVYFSINEAQFLQLTRENGSVEKAVESMPEVKLQLVDGTTYNLPGRVESASGVVDRATGSVQLRAVFDNPSHILHSGSTGKVIIPIIYKDALTIPTTAAVQIQNKFRVMTVDQQGIAHSKIISIHPQNDGKTYIVTSGLEEGTEVVAEGANMVKDDQKVKN